MKGMKVLKYWTWKGGGHNTHFYWKSTYLIKFRLVAIHFVTLALVLNRGSHSRQLHANETWCTCLTEVTESEMELTRWESKPIQVHSYFLMQDDRITPLASTLPRTNAIPHCNLYRTSTIVLTTHFRTWLLHRLKTEDAERKINMFATPGTQRNIQVNTTSHSSAS